MALAVVAARYRDAIEAAKDRPTPIAAPTPMLRLAADPALIAAALDGRSGPCRLRLDFDDPAELAALSLAPGGLGEALLPPGAELRAARLEGRELVLDLQLPA